jgi:hypothetical protein
MAEIFYGPGGTAYQTIAVSARGRAGAADLGDGRVRVRVEPASDAIASAMTSELVGWTKPTSSNCRFSIVVSGHDRAATEAQARLVLGLAEPEPAPTPTVTLAGCAQQARDLATALEALRG